MKRAGFMTCTAASHQGAIKVPPASHFRMCEAHTDRTVNNNNGEQEGECEHNVSTAIKISPSRCQNKSPTSNRKTYRLMPILGKMPNIGLGDISGDHYFNVSSCFKTNDKVLSSKTYRMFLYHNNLIYQKGILISKLRTPLSSVTS